MKMKLLQSIEKLYFFLAAVLFLVLVSDLFGQEKHISELTDNKYALQNLIMGIHSDNPGVRESTIYFAGEYRFIETEDELIKQLKVETESDIKVLIGLALFRMNSEKGMNALQELSKSDSSLKVRRMSNAIFNEFLVNYSNGTVNVK